MSTISSLLKSSRSLRASIWEDESERIGFLKCFNLQACDTEGEASHQILLELLDWADHNRHDAIKVMVCRSVAVLVKSCARNDICTSVVERARMNAAKGRKADLWTLTYMANINFTIPAMESLAAKWIEREIEDLEAAAFLLLSACARKGSIAALQCMATHIEKCDEAICDIVVPVLGLLPKKSVVTRSHGHNHTGDAHHEPNMTNDLFLATVRSGNKGVAFHASACKAVVRLAASTFDEHMVTTLMRWAEDFLTQISSQPEPPTDLSFEALLADRPDGSCYLHSFCNLIETCLKQSSFSPPSTLPSLICKLLRHSSCIPLYDVTRLLVNLLKAGIGCEDFLAFFKTVEDGQQCQVNARILLELAKHGFLWPEVAPVLQVAVAEDSRCSWTSWPHAAALLAEMAKSGVILEDGLDVQWDAICLLTSHGEHALRELAWIAMSAWQRHVGIDEATAMTAVEVVAGDSRDTVRLAACQVVTQSIQNSKVSDALMQVLLEWSEIESCDSERIFAVATRELADADISLPRGILAKFASALLRYVRRMAPASHHRSYPSTAAMLAFMRRGWIEYSALMEAHWNIIADSLMCPNLGVSPALEVVLSNDCDASAFSFAVNLILAERVHCKLLRSLQRKASLRNAVWMQVVSFIGLLHPAHISLATLGSHWQPTVELPCGPIAAVSCVADSTAESNATELLYEAPENDVITPSAMPEMTDESKEAEDEMEMVKQLSAQEAFTQDILKAILLSKSDAIGRHDVAFGHLTNHSKEIRNAIKDSPLLQERRACLVDFDISPSWANGAIVLAPLTLDQATELLDEIGQLDVHSLRPHNIFILREDVPLLHQVIRNVPHFMRSKYRFDVDTQGGDGEPTIFDIDGLAEVPSSEEAVPWVAALPALVVTHTSKTFIHFPMPRSSSMVVQSAPCGSTYEPAKNPRIWNAHFEESSLEPSYGCDA